LLSCDMKHFQLNNERMAVDPLNQYQKL